MRPIPFRTKQYKIKGVITSQEEMDYALDGMVDRLYEELTDTVQANGEHHAWRMFVKDFKRRRKPLETSMFGCARGYVHERSRYSMGVRVSEVTRMYIALQILDDVRLEV